VLFARPRSAEVSCREATLRTHPSSGQAAVSIASIAIAPCLPHRASVGRAKIQQPALCKAVSEY